jgi:hypothetical protein
VAQRIAEEVRVKVEALNTAAVAGRMVATSCEWARGNSRTCEIGQ